MSYTTERDFKEDYIELFGLSDGQFKVDNGNFQDPLVDACFKMWEKLVKTECEKSHIKELIPEDPVFFSHDVEYGFNYHPNLKDAKEVAESYLDYYRDRLDCGEDIIGNTSLNKLCYGIVLQSSDYNIDGEVSSHHHENGEHTHLNIGDDIISLSFYSENTIKSLDFKNSELSPLINLSEEIKALKAKLQESNDAVQHLKTESSGVHAALREQQRINEDLLEKLCGVDAGEYVLMTKEITESIEFACTDYFSDICIGENYEAYVRLIDIESSQLYKAIISTKVNN